MFLLLRVNGSEGSSESGSLLEDDSLIGQAMLRTSARRPFLGLRSSETDLRSGEKASGEADRSTRRIVCLR